MLPSLLANEIQNGLQQFLITGFEPSDPLFSGVIRRFADNAPQWIKGPYVQLGLPFRAGKQGKDFFGHFSLSKTGYTHQEASWQRLASNQMAANTLVATGTGSGKTECFLYPVLDHCAREIEKNQVGIKALIIYPMNALANDQARRFAEVISQTPAFKNLRVGLFVGGKSGAGGTGMVMSEGGVITDRDTLRKSPPDILLTNYKMLDYLLIRPRDRHLWDKNSPTTLRYVVVDELHTFDGAQGTDLALLLRRLRARLKTPKDHIICAGTSATLGSNADTTLLRDYARQIFGADFADDSVIREDRLSEAEFLGDSAIEHVLQPGIDFGKMLDASQYSGQEAVIKAWFPVFFPSASPPANVADMKWRANLGGLLKKHLLFVNLLKILRGKIVDIATLQDQMLGPLPETARPHIRSVLDALIALVAWARDPDEPERPLVTVRIHLWMRELRRMVAKVSADSNQIDLRASSDLKPQKGVLHLPLIQCADCHTTGWLGRMIIGQSKVRSDLDEIYNTWFGRQPEALRLYSNVGISRPLCEGVPQRLCTSCGNLQTGNGDCISCGLKEWVDVFRITATTTTTTAAGLTYTWHDPTCPACGSRDRQVLLGARNATLGSVAIEHTWASSFNDDKKLIAFSDSVQDAAHRAGFFTARTYANTVRTGLAKVIDLVARPSCAWPDFLNRVANAWLEKGSALQMPVERFVAEFIGPNMTWQRDWAESLQTLDVLPEDSRLPSRVQKRLAWQAFAEFTYQSRRGRNLDIVGKATLAPSLEKIQIAVTSLLQPFKETFGLRHLDEDILFKWIWGFLCHLRRSGAVMHPELGNYAKESNIYSFMYSQGRREWVPSMGDRMWRPIYLSLGQHRGFDKITKAVGQTSYQTWLNATLGSSGLLPQKIEVPLYDAAIKALEDVGLLIRTTSDAGDSIALNPATLTLQTEVVALISPQGKRRLTVPKDVSEKLKGMPCLDAPQEKYENIVEAGGWLANRYSSGDLRRVFSAEHTGLLSRDQREALEARFKSPAPKPWYENLLSATPTLEMGVDIGALSSVLLCSVPPNQASYLQRIGRAGRRDGNALTTTLADGNSPHDLYFFEDTEEMLSGEVVPPGIFLKAAEVLRRQLFAFCLDSWVGSGVPDTALPDKTSAALDARDGFDKARFPLTFFDYLDQQQELLLQEFLLMLGDDIDDRVQQRLKDFMYGTDSDDGLKLRLNKLLEELSHERQTHKKRAEHIAKNLKILKARPKDEAIANEIDQLDRERDKLLELVKEINQRELLNTFTDAGLIPNYAFPEAGIELKSLLWRKRGNEDEKGGPYISLPVERYERPANSALSEFAPENVFYANQHRVEIDQINLSLSKLEWWRLCPSCHHMENLELNADSHPACPNCGESLWSNSSQKRQMLRFKQAIANSNDSDARIDDSADDREPKFYVRQLLADFEQGNITEAYRLKAQDLPFGFEFISQVKFRDVNFGEPTKPGETYRVADQERARPGFKLCRHCGQIQRAPRNSREREQGQFHAFDCEKRGNSDSENIIECLYLYREFSSEALRILVPYTLSGVDDEAIESFMAAVQLGLKKRFGGRVDHLRIVAQEVPGKDGDISRKCVLLYDSIPGGTGYLHQLLTNEASTLIEVFRLALAQLSSCKCNANPDKDGCYRCVYQYRLGRAMPKVSRNRARIILTYLVSALDQLEKVKTIADIYVNPNFDSDLEAKFVESLRRLSGQGRLPFVKLVQDLVHGKSGYLIQVADQRYWLEPQVDLGQNDGIQQPSRPDFVLWPTHSKSRRRPVAVFCDGWAYHKNIAPDDAKKRSALVASGRFWVWSVTWEDVKSALSGSLETDLTLWLSEEGIATASTSPATQSTISEFIAKHEGQIFNRNSIANLIEWLGSAVGQEVDFTSLQMARSAGALAARMIPHPTDSASVGSRAELEAFWLKLSFLQDMRPQRTVPCGNSPSKTTTIQYLWPASLIEPTSTLEWSLGFICYDNDQDKGEQIQHKNWRCWLWLYNAFQMLPGMLLVTYQNLMMGEFSNLHSKGAKPASAGQGAVYAAAWKQVIDLAVSALRPDLQTLSDENFPPPDEIGFEFEKDGNVIAEAELAWKDKKVVILLPHQKEYLSNWEKEHWYVVLVDQGWLELLRRALQKGDAA